MDALFGKRRAPSWGAHWKVSYNHHLTSTELSMNEWGEKMFPCPTTVTPWVSVSSTDGFWSIRIGNMTFGLV
jgi:hypothetical protein